MLRIRQMFAVLLVAGLAGLVTGSAQAGEPSETAEYLLIFDATWSADSHPDDFPGGAHFSGLIGGTHDDTVAFWEQGQLASEGIERMAETGSKTVLRAEVQAEIDAGNAGEVISGPGISSSPGMAQVSFTATQQFPLATVVSMIAPSPDWFVGVDGTLLFEDGDWLDQVVVELPPWDAGTDSGVTYGSPNQDTQPPDPIAELTGYPFFNEMEGRVLPLGTFTIVRTDDPCAADVDNSGGVDFADILSILSAWGSYEPCPPFVAQDINIDCAVDFADLLEVLANWGTCP